MLLLLCPALLEVDKIINAQSQAMAMYSVPLNRGHVGEDIYHKCDCCKRLIWAQVQDNYWSILGMKSIIILHHACIIESSAKCFVIRTPM